MRRTGSVVVAVLAAMVAGCSGCPVAAKDLPAGTPPEVAAAFTRARGEMGYYVGGDGEGVVTAPYSPAAAQAIAGFLRASVPGPAKSAYLRILPVAVFYWRNAAPELETALAASLSELGGSPDPPDAEGLGADARRCLWNLEYASASLGGDVARVSMLEQEATSALSSPCDYLGDLLRWFVSANPSEGLARVVALERVHGPDERIVLAKVKLGYLASLATQPDDDGRVAVLIGLVEGEETAEAVRCWAARTLGAYPTDKAKAFLENLFAGGPDDEDGVMVRLEAQEALKRLGRLPLDAYRYAVP